ncbi:VOC family protein [Arthrobacter sp. CAU 1506]|nr:VOC family protein [Arthrobacter sp. CAU 1506]
MGAVELRVKDLPTVRRFYEEGVGLEPLDETGDSVSLGIGGEEIIRLVAAEGDYTNPADAGLYHSAVLYSDGPALATTLVRLIQMAPNLYQGSADHAVSHAFYFADPEGNGVELYIDTPADTWKWQDGQVQMGSAPLDPNDFIARHLGQTSDGTAAMGHVHLKVGDLERAREFYVDALGFAVTSEINGALFMSAGGYHHHLAANVWSSAGADDRPETLGLGSFAVQLTGPAELDAVAGRLDAAGIDYQRAEGSIAVADPWGNQVHLSH